MLHGHHKNTMIKNLWLITAECYEESLLKDGSVSIRGRMLWGSLLKDGSVSIRGRNNQSVTGEM